MELGSSKLRKLLEEFVRSGRKVRPVRKCCHLIESTVSRDLRHLSKIEKKNKHPTGRSHERTCFCSSSMSTVVHIGKANGFVIFAVSTLAKELLFGSVKDMS